MKYGLGENLALDNLQQFQNLEIDCDFLGNHCDINIQSCGKSPQYQTYTTIMQNFVSYKK